MIFFKIIIPAIFFLSNGYKEILINACLVNGEKKKKVLTKGRYRHLKISGREVQIVYEDFYD